MFTHSGFYFEMRNVSRFICLFVQFNNVNEAEKQQEMMFHFAKVAVTNLSFYFEKRKQIRLVCIYILTFFWFIDPNGAENLQKEIMFHFSVDISVYIMLMSLP